MGFIILPAILRLLPQPSGSVLTTKEATIDPRTTVACHDCDLLHRVRSLPPRCDARCSRCGAIIYRPRVNSLERALMLTIAGAILFLITNLLPFMTFSFKGREQVNTMATGVVRLWQTGQEPLAVLIAFTSIVAPALKIAALLYVLLPLRLGFVAPATARVFRLHRSVQPWGMLEVYMLGGLVSIIKLAQLAHIELDVAFWSFCGLMVITTAAQASLDPRVVWSRLGERT